MDKSERGREGKTTKNKILRAKMCLRLLVLLLFLTLWWSSCPPCWLSPCRSNTPGRAAPAPECVAVGEGDRVSLAALTLRSGGGGGWWRGGHLQTREELDELGEERQEDEPDEAGLARRLGHFIPVHEGRHWEAFEFLRVALKKHV